MSVCIQLYTTCDKCYMHSSPCFVRNSKTILLDFLYHLALALAWVAITKKRTRVIGREAKHQENPHFQGYQACVCVFARVVYYTYTVIYGLGLIRVIGNGRRCVFLK